MSKTTTTTVTMKERDKKTKALTERAVIADQIKEPAFMLARPDKEHAEEWEKAVRKAVRLSLEKEHADYLLEVYSGLKAACYDGYDSDTMDPVPSSYTYVMGMTDHKGKKAALSVSLKLDADGSIIASKGTKVSVKLTADDRGKVMLSGEIVRAARKGYTWDKATDDSHKRLVADLVKYLTDKSVISYTSYSTLVEKCERRIRQAIASMLIWQVMTHGSADRPAWLSIPDKVVAVVVHKEEKKAC